MKTRPPKATLAAMLALIIGLSLATVTTSAQADPGNAFDAYAITVPDVRVNSGACRSIPASVLHNGTDLEDSWATVEMWHGSTYVEQAALFDMAPGRISGSFLHCPSSEGLGVFRLGPSEVHYATTDYQSTGEFRDGTTATFSVLQDSRVSKFAAKRSGKSRTFTGKATFYDVANSRWASMPKRTKIRLQRQTNRGAWVSAKTGRITAGGKFKIALKTSRKARYRAVVTSGHQTWSATSKTIRK